jgi:hypothetical protein
MARKQDMGIDDTIREHNAKQIFIRDAMPDSWFNYAAELEESAEILWEQHENGLRVELTETFEGDQIKKISSISRSYILLAGFAIENLLKGLLIVQDPSHINTGQLSNDLKSHRLLDLASKLEDLSLDDEEYHICKVLQDAIPYWGRYPIPLEYNGVMPEIGIDLNFRRVFLKLHFRLSKLIYYAIRDGWDSQAGLVIGKIRDRRFDTIDYNESL